MVSGSGFRNFRTLWVGDAGWTITPRIVPECVNEIQWSLKSIRLRSEVVDDAGTVGAADKGKRGVHQAYYVS